MIYIKEIHPSDGWQVRRNEEDGVIVPAHRSMEERIDVAQTCVTRLALEMPALVDEMDDRVARLYGGMPERLYFVGRDGSVVYRGGVGPMFFFPEEWEDAIARHLSAEAS